MKAAWFACALLAGCALEPDVLRLEAIHDSHLTQHEPFTNHPTNYGSNGIALAAGWQRGPIFVEVSEGYVFNGLDGCEECPRENFTATVGYEWRLK